MQKPFPHTARSSSVFCQTRGCGKPIKMNVVVRKPTKNSFDCYKCYKAKEFIRKNKRK